jgi:hypothetical protein
MNRIDWSKAPAWADKHGFSSYGCHPVWLNNDQYCYVDGSQGGRIFSFYAHEGWQLSEIHNISLRTIQKAWTGEGLPPVGTVCKFSWVYGGNEFKKSLQPGAEVTIIAHYENNGDTVAAFTYLVPGGKDVEAALESCFSPIPTPEQIAMEERKRVVEAVAEELKDLSGPKCLGVLYGLYDLGYLKQVAP